MGACVSKKTEDCLTSNLIIETSSDKYINYIKGQLYLNSERCRNVDIYLYEDYLHIKRYHYEKNKLL